MVVVVVVVVVVVKVLPQFSRLYRQYLKDRREQWHAVL
jgi:type II secretory pathway component PulF